MDGFGWFGSEDLEKMSNILISVLKQVWVLLVLLIFLLYSLFPDYSDPLSKHFTLLFQQPLSGIRINGWV